MRSSLTNIQEQDFQRLFLQGNPLIDVRAPVEFSQGSLPGAINLPIMNDDERAQVGIVYKQAGREAALKLGHELVSGVVREERIQNWIAQIKKSPETVLFCYRGGLRSQITQGWLHERGVDVPLIEGGYKKSRQFLRSEIDRLSATKEFVVLSGPTGSAKTHIINSAAKFYPALDLEGLAHHRGSAFGAWDIPQPSAVEFENRLALGLMKLEPQSQKWLFEDESRLIGHCALPESFFKRLRESEVMMVEESFEQRVENIFADYIGSILHKETGDFLARSLFEKYRKATIAISRKLGGLRAQEVLEDIRVSEEDYFLRRDLGKNRVWISKLLHYYYDPLYMGSLERRQPKIVFRGGAAEILERLRNLRAAC
ncbi:MAG: tRNA 2-selenouridine(34) synthase MnmH [Bdellovibrionaceae bacterium]|nr:tRNA 2-selenouridine(34) synthase MnmH [Pseudobdellovibrionaceae bacterium]